MVEDKGGGTGGIYRIYTTNPYLLTILFTKILFEIKYSGAFETNRHLFVPSGLLQKDVC